MIGSFLLSMPFVPVAMVSVLLAMASALDEVDVERFMLCVGAVSAIAALPLLQKIINLTIIKRFTAA